MKRNIPNFITCLNLLSGATGICFVFDGRFDIAFYLMLASAVFDFLDGFMARILSAYSPLGKELDSLSDLVSFGVLPSLMLVRMMQISTFSSSFMCYIPLVIAVFSGVRLAKFNLDERQKDSFVGLPTPACAILCGSLCYFIAHDSNTFLSTWASDFIFFPVLSIILASLLISEIPMFSMKLGKGTANDAKENKKRIFFLADILIIAVFCILLSLNWSVIPLIGFVVYILFNTVLAIAKV